MYSLVLSRNVGQKGSYLMEFSIRNSKLDSLTNFFIGCGWFDTEEKKKNRYMTLELSEINDTMVFVYSYFEKYDSVYKNPIGTQS